MHQNHSQFALVDASIVARDLAHEVVQLGGNLNAGKASAGDYKSEELTPQRNVVFFDGGLFKSSDHVVAQLDRVGKVLERHRVLGQPAQSTKVRYIPHRQNKVVIFDRVRVRAKPLTCSDCLGIKIDRLDVPHVEVGARQKPSNRADGVQ